MIKTPKNYLGYEDARNRKNAQLYVDIVQRALGCKWVVLVGHHVLYELGGDVNTEGEIPSADTLMFDHDIMGAVFGDRAIGIMKELASIPCDDRDQLLGCYFAQVKGDAA